MGSGVADMGFKVGTKRERGKRGRGDCDGLFRGVLEGLADYRAFGTGETHILPFDSGGFAAMGRRYDKIAS